MSRQRPLILIVLICYIFFPTIFEWATDPTGIWYKPYLVWLLVIVAAFINARRKSSHD